MSDDGWVDYAAPQSAPAQGGWVDYAPPSSAAPAQDGWVDYNSEEERRRQEREQQALQARQQPAPEAEGMLASGLRSFAHEAPAVVAGAAGAMYGAGAGAAAGPVGAIAGGVGGALVGGFGGAAVADTGLKALGYDDSHQRAVNEKANPWSSAIGQGLAQVLGFGAGTASTAARLAGAGIGAGIEGGAQLYEGDFSASKLATQAAAGAAFTNPYKWGTRIEQAGQRAGEEIATGYRSREAEKFVGPRQPEGPPEFVGPRQPYNPPEMQGPQQPYGPPEMQGPKQPEPHGSAGPKSDSFGSETPIPPAKDSDVGDAHQVRGERSNVEYMKKPDSEIPGDQGAGLNTGGRDPDLELAIKSKSGPEQPPPVAEPPQGRPMGEQPAPPPAAGGLTPAEMQELTELRAAAAQRAAPPPAAAAQTPPGPAQMGAEAAQMPPPRRAPPGRNTDDLSLIDYLAANGGLQDNPEVRAAVQANPFIPGFGQLVRKDGGGMPLDRAWELVTTGNNRYIHDEGALSPNRQYETSWQDLARMINEEAGGKPHFQLGREGTQRTLKDAGSAVADENRFRRDRAVDEFLDNPDLDLPDVGPRTRDRMRQIMEKNNIDDPAVAYERSITEGDTAKPGRGEPAPPDIPFETMDAQLRRREIERGISGRPIRTEPMDVRPEVGNRILEQGAERLRTTPRPEVSGEPTMEAMARKGPPMSREEMQRLIAESGKTATQVPMTSRAIGKGTLTQAAADAGTLNVREAGVATPPPAAATAKVVGRKREAQAAVPPVDQVAANEARMAEIQAQLDAKVAAAVAAPAPKPTKGEELKAKQAAKAEAAKPATGGLTPEEMKELVALRAQAQARQGQPVNGKPAPAAIQGIPVNVGAAAQAGAGAPPAGAPPAGAPPAGAPPAGRPPGGPPPGAPPPAAAAAGQPNMAHTPPQQRSWFNELWRDVQRKVAPHLLGPGGMEARRIIRGAYGEATRLAEQTSHLLNTHKETIQPMPDADRWAMINQMQGGNAFPNFRPSPEQRAFMRDFERSMQEWEGKMKTLDATEQANFRDHYMAQMYENPQAAGGMFSGAGKRGGSGSLKLRKYDTYEDAKAAGLIPKTSDPIEIGTRYINTIQKFVASRQVMERAELTGTVQRFAAPKIVGAAGSPTPLVKGGPPLGWKKLDTPEIGGRAAYADPDFADTFNNFYGQGFSRNDPTGRKTGIYDTTRNSTNAWTQVELGLNAYHAFTMANEGIISKVGDGLNQMFAGNVRGGLKTMAGAPLTPIPGKKFGEFIERKTGVTTSYLEGKRFQDEYLNPNSTNPIATIIAEANGRPIGRGHAADYTFQERGSFINKFSADNIRSELQQAGKDISEDYAKAMAGTKGQKALFPLQQVGRAIQTVSAPLFDKYIPLMKAGAVHSQMNDWHKIMVAKDPTFDMLNNPAHRKEAVNAAMKIVDSVDNRFGEMIHDNLFMDNTLKQSAQIMMRSFSWAVGSMKEIGGGTAATGKSLYKLAASKGAENRFNPTHPEWDSRMAYAMAWPLALTVGSTMYQFLRSGEKPESWRDIYAPKTGGTVPGVGGRGQVPEHVLMPGYHKDVLGWTHHPIQEVYNKLGGLPQTVIEQSRGTDWRGDPLVRPNATLTEAAIDRMTHIVTKAIPISIKSITKGTEPTSRISGFETALGFRAPGAFIQDPEGLERAMKFKEKRAYDLKTKRERKIELRQNP